MRQRSPDRCGYTLTKSSVRANGSTRFATALPRASSTISAQASDYLLLRAAQMESFWTPIHGPIGFGEKLESAIRREE